MSRYIYLSGFYLNIDDGELNISKSKEEYKQDIYGVYKLLNPYFVSNDYSIYVLDGYLDRELKITDNLSCFYSLDENKVDEWLNKKKKELIEIRDKYIKICNQLGAVEMEE